MNPDVEESSSLNDATADFLPSAHRFHEALRDRPVTIWQQNKALEYLWIYNPALDYSSSQVIGKRDIDLFERAEDATATEEIKRRVIETGVAEQQEIAIAHKGIEKYYDLRVDPLFSEDHSIIGITGVAVDITHTKSMAEALRQSEGRLKSVLDASVHCIYRYDLQNNCYEYFSPSSEKILGFTPDEMLAKTIDDGFDLLHPNDRDNVQFAIESLPYSGEIEVEYRQRMKDGEYRWLTNRMKIINDSHGQPHFRCGSIRDSTERKLVEQRLQQLAAVVETSDDFIGAATLDGNIFFLNPAARLLMGIEAGDDITNYKLADYFYESDLLDAFELLENVLRRGQASMETRFRHFKTGEPIDVFWKVMALYDKLTGEPYAYATVTRDIREQKQMENERARIAARRDEISAAIQRSLLLAPPKDAYAGIRSETYYQSASRDALIGGDFFDVFPVSADLIALVVGDATGKGIAAATYTAEVKFAFRAFLRQCQGQLAEAVSCLNRFIFENICLDAAHDATCCVALTTALVNRLTGETHCTCAGGEFPVILRTSTGEVEDACDYGLLLGLDPDTQYTSNRLFLDRGDLVALTSDGVTEAHLRGSIDLADRGLEAFFGINGVKNMLRSAHPIGDKPLTDVLGAIVEGALNKTDGDQRDDFCLLLAQFC